MSKQTDRSPYLHIFFIRSSHLIITPSSIISFHLLPPAERKSFSFFVGKLSIIFFFYFNFSFSIRLGHFDYSPLLFLFYSSHNKQLKRMKKKDRLLIQSSTPSEIIPIFARILFNFRLRSNYPSFLLLYFKDFTFLSILLFSPPCVRLYIVTVENN